MIDVYNDGDGILFKLTGEFDFEEILNRERELFCSSTFIDIKYLIIDRTSTKNYNLTPEQARKLAQLCVQASSINPSMVHILISATKLEHGMANLFKGHAQKSGWLFKNFSKLSEAEDWLSKNFN